MISTINRPARSLRANRQHDDVTGQMSAVAFPTELDWMALAWRNDALVGLVFGHPSERSARLSLARSLRATPEFCPLDDAGQGDEQPTWVGTLIDDLRRFAAGEPVEFRNVPLALEHLTPFGRRVTAECRRLAWGRVSTYGDLASAAGKPGAARAVGSVMAKNRYPLIVPCHRVLAASGGLGGYSAPDGLQMKRRLLAMERATSQ